MKIKHCSVCQTPINSKATYCKPCWAKSRKPHNWKGGRIVARGYVLVYAPDNPMAEKRGYVYEHRLVMSEMIGRPLNPQERVHHIDGNPLNNAPENLRLFASNGEHTKHHDNPPNPKSPDPLGWRKHKTCPMCGVGISDWAKSCRKHKFLVKDPTWVRHEQPNAQYSKGKTCPDCGKPVNNQATWCMKCGPNHAWETKRKALSS